MPENALSPDPASHAIWSGDLTRVPFWVYRAPAMAKLEQDPGI